MNGKRDSGGAVEWIRIQERALANLADSLTQEETATREDIRELKAELKALKLFLSRNVPEFKKQFPDIRRKVA